MQSNTHSLDFEICNYVTPLQDQLYCGERLIATPFSAFHLYIYIGPDTNSDISVAVMGI